MLETLANLGDFIAAIGVIISLVYLAKQMRHASDLARVEAHQKFNDSIFSVLEDVAKDPELHSIYRRGVWKNESLDENERDRLGMLLYRSFGSYSSAFYASQIDPDLKSLSQTGLNVLLGQPFVQEWWGRHRMNFLPDFRAAIDSKAKELESPSNKTNESAT